MSSLSLVESNLPAGFRFHPRDEELVCDYLMTKVTGSDHLQRPLIIQVDLNKCEPWDIPQVACVGGKEWYFYSQRDKKYATGLRTNRATISGYWKATGKDKPVVRKGRLVGMRKTLVFYQGRAPKGRKTDWVMHEFRLEGPLPPPKEDWVLCRLLHRNKETPAKQAMGSGGYGGDTISLSLPPLTETYNITFDDHYHHLNYEYEQVPCFSIFNTPNQTTSSIFSQTTHTHMDPNLSSDLTTLGSMSTPILDDEKALKAVLNHLTTMETNYNPAMKNDSSSFGEGSSSDCFLSQVGLPASMRNQY